MIWPGRSGAARDAFASGERGAVIIADERVADTFTVPGDDVERYMYGFSALHCLPVGMVDHPSVETGTVMRPQTLRGYAPTLASVRLRSCRSPLISGTSIALSRRVRSPTRSFDTKESPQ